MVSSKEESSGSGKGGANARQQHIEAIQVGLEPELPPKERNQETAEAGRRGGLKRAERQTAEERSALARYTAGTLASPGSTGSEGKSPGDYLPYQTGKDGKQLPLFGFSPKPRSSGLRPIGR